MGGCPKRGLSKFKCFKLLSWTHETFKKTKHKGKIKFDRVWEFQNGVSPFNRAAKIQIFLITHARHMRFLGLAKYEEKIKPESIWGYQNRGPLKRGHQNSNF